MSSLFGSFEANVHQCKMHLIILTNGLKQSFMQNTNQTSLILFQVKDKSWNQILIDNTKLIIGTLNNPRLLQYSPSDNLSIHKHRLPYKRQNFINKLFASKRGTSTSMVTYFFTCETIHKFISKYSFNKNSYFPSDSFFQNILRNNHVEVHTILSDNLKILGILMRVKAIWRI